MQNGIKMFANTQISPTRNLYMKKIGKNAIEENKQKSRKTQFPLFVTNAYSF
jgi:hypothetical protein